MKVKALPYRIMTIIVCAFTLAPFLPQPVQAGDTKEKIQVNIGKPSVWSLAQAHYLLASMHKQNDGIKIDPISSAALDPNAVNATRLQILRTVLGIQAEFNQKVGVENQDKLREDQVQLKRRADAQGELAGKEEELRTEKAKLNGLKKQLAALQETDRQRDEERQAESDAESARDSSGKITQQKFIPLTEEDQNRKKQIIVLQQKVEAQKNKVDDLASDVSTLNTQANADITPPTLTDTTFSPNTITLPTPSTNIQSLIDKTLSSAGKPSLAASIALDNYIGMQYEIIAKQLTLLRDEIGPDERVIFLELPSSIYTVPCKSEDYIVQVYWKVTDYYHSEKLCPKDKNTKVDQPASGKGADSSSSASEDEYKPKSSRIYLNDMLEEYKTYAGETKQADEEKKNQASGAAQSPTTQQKQENKKNQTRTPANPPKGWWGKLEDNSVRAIDIIPRQSALNVNDFHATVSQKNFMGVLKLLSGLGVQVNYQRQRELYEEFLQQEVFASGFGKGQQQFGWTFGPLPGTNRIAPGQRTTYAVLAVPQDASAIHLEAQAIAYKRTQTPADAFDPANSKGQNVGKGEFVVAVPNEKTEGFNVQEIAYTPVPSNSPVTVVVEGEYFSPQVNVFVENTPLTRVLNFGSGEKKELTTNPDTALSSKIKGYFEWINSKQLILTFDMGDASYVGTPNITLVTPEKTSSINFYGMKVNNHVGETSLRKISLIEPMFMKGFDLTALEVKPDPDDNTYLKARLTGTGLRRNAYIRVNDHYVKSVVPGMPYFFLPPEYAQQESTTTYNIRFKKEGGPTWKLQFRQNTIRGFEEKSLTQQFPAETASKPFEVRHYIANAGRANAEVDLRFFNTLPDGYKKEDNEKITKIEIKKVTIHPNEGTYPRDEGCVPYRRAANGIPCGQFAEDDQKYRARFEVFPFIPGSNKIDRDAITVTIYKDVTKEVTKPDKTKTTRIDYDVKEVLDIPLPVRPQITKVINTDTGKPFGFADQDVTVIIEGHNLDAIKNIFFGTQQAEIVGTIGSNSAIVKVPKLANLPKGESSTVSITVEMKSDFYEGKTLPVGTYHYIGAD
jgi:hypothetical protein